MSKLLNCFLLLSPLFFLPLSAGCSSDEPEVIEMTDEYAKLYDDYDKEFQASGGSTEYEQE